LEQLSSGNTVIHRRHPICKLLAAFIFIMTVISFDRHAFGRLIPFIFYPSILMALSETPYGLLLKRVLIAIPFCLFIGIPNLFLEKDPAFTVGNITVSCGVLSFAVIIYRTYLCVMAVLLLIAATPFTELTAQLRRMKIPNIFIIMLEMTYRCLGLLAGESESMHIAYALRGGGAKGVDIRHAGGFIGSLLTRSFDRAERIYAAMKCRGYGLSYGGIRQRVITVSDAVYCALVCFLCMFFRFVDAGRWITAFVERIS
jgi:cobalt/nickel transport system permease protein